MNIPFQTLLQRIDHIGRDPTDSMDIRLQKSLLVRGSIMFIVAGALWGVGYLFFGEPLAGMIPLTYAAISLLSVFSFAQTRRYHFFRFSQLLLILPLPFLLMVALGGFINSSGVILWSIISPLGALLFDEPGRSPRWLLAYLGLVVLSGFLQPHVRLTNNLSPNLVIAFFVLNIGAVSVIVFILLHHFVGEKNRTLHLLDLERNKSESLLLNVLPKEVAAILKDRNATIADNFENASVLFADVVGFTPLSARMSPQEMVELLNEVFSEFDSLVEKYGLEKIRTIGDNYMVAAGVPTQRSDHAQALARLALEMRDSIRRLSSTIGNQLQFRLGMNCGPMIGGVIGHQKFHYDVWGDAVNIASRMESHGLPGKIQITRTMYEILRAEFVCKRRGKIPVKGKGDMETWFLEATRA